MSPFTRFFGGKFLKFRKYACVKNLTDIMSVPHQTAKNSEGTPSTFVMKGPKNGVIRTNFFFFLRILQILALSSHFRRCPSVRHIRDMSIYANIYTDIEH